MVKELCEKVVEVRRVNDRVMTFSDDFTEVDLWVCSTK